MPKTRRPPMYECAICGRKRLWRELVHSRPTGKHYCIVKTDCKPKESE